MQPLPGAEGAALPEHHQLTDFHWLEKPYRLKALEGQKPSDILHERLNLCPTDQENRLLFLFLCQKDLHFAAFCGTVW
jgi:hypothetical protein